MKMNFKSFTNWKIGDFILQLLVVILGIVVTFAASNAVSERAKAKEVAKAMEIVKTELEENRENLEQITKRLRLEQQISTYILDHKEQPEKASADTLRRYISMPFQIWNFIYGTDAMEMLKTSSLIPNIRDKELVLKIMKAYNGLKEAKEVVTWYYDLKQKHCAPLNEDEKYSREYEEIFYREYERDAWKIIRYQLSDIHVYNIYVLAAKGVDFENTFQETHNILSEAIEMIDREYSPVLK